MNLTSNITSLSQNHCLLYRFVGCLLLIISLINLFFTFHYFIKRYYKRHDAFVPNRLSPIILGMSISSALVIFTAVPFTAVQCFSCRPYLGSEFIGKLHAFLCFSTGLFNMYIVVLLSFLRYLSILHKSNWFNKFLEKHRDLSVLFCGFVAICWALPPFFNIRNKYIPDESGFYYSLKWNDPAISSRIFVISLIFFNYLFPFVLVIYSNLRVWCILRHLLKSHHDSTYLSVQLSSPLSTTNTMSSANQSTSLIDLRKRFTDAYLKQTTNRLQRLKIDQRYACITAIIAAQYLIIWTPYAFIVLLKFSGETYFLEHHPFLPTLFSLFAKFALILNPIILIYTNKMTQT